MIKSISINYPEFWSGLKIDREFTSGINIIEENNAYWKSTILKTIMSLYTWKFGTSKTLPEWYASIETDKTKYVLSKWKWIGKDFEDNELYMFCNPWLFFTALPSTPKQREVLVKLLWLDYLTFMKDKIDKSIEWNVEYYKELSTFNDKTEDELKAKLKESLAKEWTILEDIMRLKSKLINKEEKDFSDVLGYREAVADIQRQAQEHNKWLAAVQQQHQKLLANIRTLENSIYSSEQTARQYDSQIETLNKQLEWLRSEYTIVQDQSTCDKCGSKLPEDKLKIRLDWILSTANLVKANIEQANNNKNKLLLDAVNNNKELAKLKSDLDFFVLPETIDTNNIEECVMKLNLNRIPKLEARRELEYEEYLRYLNELSFVQNELNLKETQLKSMDSIRLQNSLDTIKWFKQMFTEYLEQETKKLPVDIELFKENKDWSIRESFIIRKDWIEYSELSQWNKALVEIALAKVFIDKLWVETILVDEANSLSKDNIWLLKELAKTHQLIVCKASNWTVKDLK